MAKSGEIYFDLSSWGYANISLGCYNSQDDSSNFIGSEQTSAYGTLSIFNIANKKQYSLQSTPMTFAEFKTIENFIISTAGSPVPVYIDTEGGTKICKARVSGNRIVSADGTNDKYKVNLNLQEV